MSQKNVAFFLSKCFLTPEDLPSTGLKYDLQLSTFLTYGSSNTFLVNVQ